MRVCYVCCSMFTGEHECAVAKQLIEHPAPSPDAPWINFEPAGIKPLWAKTAEWDVPNG